MGCGSNKSVNTKEENNDFFDPLSEAARKKSRCNNHYVKKINV